MEYPTNQTSREGSWEEKGLFDSLTSRLRSVFVPTPGERVISLWGRRLRVSVRTVDIEHGGSHLVATPGIEFCTNLFSGVQARWDV